MVFSLLMKCNCDMQLQFCGLHVLFQGEPKFSSLYCIYSGVFLTLIKLAQEYFLEIYGLFFLSTILKRRTSLMKFQVYRIKVQI